MRIAIIKCQVIWRVIFSKKFIFFHINHKSSEEATIHKAIVGINSKQDIARFLKNEASKLTWGKAHTDIKNLKL